MENKHTKLMLAVFAVILMIGISFVFGYMLASLKEPVIQTSLSQDQQSLEALILTSNLDYTNTSLSCAILEAGIGTLSNNLNELSNELNSAMSGSVVTPQYSQLSNQLTYTRLNFWVLVQRTNEECGNKFVNLLMFYPGSSTCNGCVNEGQELAYISYISNYTTVATVLNAHANVSAVSALDRYYNVTTFPMLVINGKYIVKGYLTTPQIIQYICKYSSSSDLCKQNISS